MKYKAIRESINSAQQKALNWIVELEDAKIICFSDHHRGKRDGADDFLPCERTYLHALKYYLDRDYTLILLGDVEELWECMPDQSISSYPEISALEAEFHKRQRYYRIWGNHDDLWQFPDRVKFHFEDQLPFLQVTEAIDMEVHLNNETIGKILWIHGHQGTLLSSKLASLSKFFVRFLWRPIQRLFRVPLNTASNTPELRYKTDRALDYWASIRQRQLVVSGHTHQYLFGSLAQPDSPEKPCYFNTGCCSYGNGNISGIEISNQKIRLVEWEPHSSEPFYIQTEFLTELFDRCE